MALALYRKYRPATFAEVVGQEHVTAPLVNAVDGGRINHAYLFSGPRGCGKTSSARILARSLNCEQGPTSTPCGVCVSCVALAPDGPGSIDVIEIDAASHGGVDDARDLRERAFFAPVHSRYKVYIVDEAHMVTTAGFNALLKVVEEPPEFLVFVFATTEPEKVLPTIRSRTHHYPFRLVPPTTLRQLLETTCEREGVSVEPTVFPLVVRAGGGSVRDSLSILDQLLAGAGPEGVTYRTAVGLLGVTDDALLDETVDALAARDAPGVFQAVDRVVEAGHDPRRFATDLLDRLRDLIVLDAVPEAGGNGLLDCPPDRLDLMSRQATALGQATLSRLADTVHAGLTEMRGTTAPRLLLELVCARMLLPGVDGSAAATLQRLERLERRLSIAGEHAGAAGGDPAAGAPVPSVPASPASASPVPAAPAPDPSGGAARREYVRPSQTRPEPAREQSRPEPTRQAPSRPEPVRHEQPGADVAGVDAADSQPARHEPAQQEPARQESARTEPGRADSAGAGSAGAESEGQGTAQQQPARQDQRRDEPATSELAAGTPTGTQAAAASAPSASAPSAPAPSAPALPASTPSASAPSSSASSSSASSSSAPASTADDGWPAIVPPGSARAETPRTQPAAPAAAEVDGWPEIAQPGAPAARPAQAAPAPTGRSTAGPSDTGGPVGTPARSGPDSGTGAERSNPRAADGEPDIPLPPEPTDDEDWAPASRTAPARPAAAPAPAAPSGNAASAAGDPPPRAAAESSPAPRGGDPMPLVSANPPDQQADDGELTTTDVRRIWPELLAVVKRNKRTTEALLKNAQVHDLTAGVLTLSTTSPALSRRLGDDLNKDVIRGALQELLGVRWRVATVVAGGDAAPAAGGGAPQGPPPTQQETQRAQYAAQSAEADELMAERAADPVDGADAPPPVDPEQAALQLLRTQLGAHPVDS